MIPSFQTPFGDPWLHNLIPGSGGTGVAGAAGSPGTPGTPGTPGATGPPGSNGSNGSNGTPGTPGSNGSDGTPGTPGSEGAPGPTGPPGQNGKEAVVDTSAGPRALFCVESDQIWFTTTLQISFDPAHPGPFALPPLFEETVLVDTLLVMACVPATICMWSAAVRNGWLYVEATRPVDFTVTVAGIRKGTDPVTRMPARTPQQMAWNNQNWLLLSGAGLINTP